MIVAADALSVFAFPPPLAPGDLVTVVAPSSPFEPTPVWLGLGWLASRYKLRFDRRIFERKGYLAGDDACRRRQLEEALAAPEVKAIFAARGGYGASRYAHEIDWRSLAARPKWIVGFSDVTVLHVEATRLGVASIHGAHVSAFGRSDARTRDAMTRVLEHPRERRVFEGLPILRHGAFAGPLVGGNLSMLHASAAAGRLALPRACVLFIEDISERPYRLDRALTTLMAGGHLSNVGAVILGDFVQCDAGPDGTTVRDVMNDRVATLGVPVIAAFPSGHAVRNEPLVLGGRAEVHATGMHGTVALGPLA